MSYVADGEVIFGNLNQVYPIRILGEPKMEGTNAVDLYAAYYSNIVIKLGKIGETLQIYRAIPS